MAFTEDLICSAVITFDGKFQIEGISVTGDDFFIITPQNRIRRTLFSTQKSKETHIAVAQNLTDALSTAAVQARVVLSDQGDEFEHIFLIENSSFRNPQVSYLREGEYGTFSIPENARITEKVSQFGWRLQVNEVVRNYGHLLNR